MQNISLAGVRQGKKAILQPAGIKGAGVGRVTLTSGSPLKPDASLRYREPPQFASKRHHALFRVHRQSG
jgi:hypothetical protein